MNEKRMTTEQVLDGVARPWAARPLWQQLDRETSEHRARHADEIMLAARGAA